VDIGGSIARILVIPALPAFFRKFPGIQIDLGIGDRTVNLIEDNIDCVVRGGTVTDLALVSRLLGTSAFVTCATPAYLAEFGTPSHPTDLLIGHRMVAYQSAASGRSFPAIFEHQGEQLEIEAPFSVSVNDGLARLSAGLAGLGIIQTFAFMVREHIARGQLIPILTEWSPSSYPFHVVYPPNRHLSNRVRVFIDWLVELFESI
jgi:LysR family transcriptional regulator for bpeEF and oprC